MTLKHFAIRSHDTPPTFQSRNPILRRAWWLVSFIALLFGCLESTPTVYAQAKVTGTVVGRVLNPATGEYVANAEVRLADSDRTAVSEQGGYYRLDCVPPGTAKFTGVYTGETAETATV